MTRADPSQDVFVPAAPPLPRAVAWADRDGATGQAELLARAREIAAGRTGARLLTDVDPASDRATTTLLAALVAEGSMVLVAGALDEQWPARHEDERATDVLRSATAR